MSFAIPDYTNAKIILVGDVMLDRYWHGSASRVSPEAPVPVVHVNDIVECPGGAGNVALNLKSLGCDVSLFGMIGDDEAGDSLIQHLEKSNVRHHLHRISDYPTVTKLRVIARNQQLIRLDFEKAKNNVVPEQLLTKIKSELESADIVIISDYAKGIINIISQVIKLAREHHVPVIVDPKSREFSAYCGASILTPNMKEFENAVGHCHDEISIAKKGKMILENSGIESLLVTRGEHGMSLLQRNCDPIHFPTRAQQVYDVTGAGDTVIAVLGASLAAKASLEDSVRLANTAAGIAVSKLGAASVSVPEIRRALRRRFNADVGVFSEQDLLQMVHDAKAHNEKIVMTNGCFDILHAGHVHYLEQARSLGDRLIIAVNDDASVARLKGSDRPIVPLKYRMSMLAALSSVDWVVPFGEDTPARLIGEVLPDVLVKGGDYKVPEIAGSEAVLANGGEVKILDFVDGFSTSYIVEKIQSQKEMLEVL